MTTVEQPVRDAATVVLVRDAAAGPELLMLKRTSRTAFGPGAYVFPGGAIDRADADPAWLALAPGFDPAAAGHRLGDSKAPWQYAVAAVRECFEEAGVLLAEPPPGGAWPSEASLDQARAQLNAGALDFHAFCTEQDLRLPLADLVYYSHWITPPGQPRRFSTRFFMALAPAGQEGVHDGSETVDSCWITPAAALAAWKAGEFRMILPTVKQLEFLQNMDSAEAMLAAVRAIDPVPTIAPGSPRS